MNMNLREIIERLETSTGFMLGVSFVAENNKIDHILITDNFQTNDMLASNNYVRELIIKELEKMESPITPILPEFQNGSEV